jgi:hypothetical protein
MYSASNVETLTESGLVVGITCLPAAMRPATSGTNNSIQYCSARTVSLFSAVLPPVD